MENKADIGNVFMTIQVANSYIENLEIVKTALLSKFKIVRPDYKFWEFQYIAIYHNHDEREPRNIILRVNVLTLEVIPISDEKY